MKKNCVIKIEHLTKEYRLGVIGSGTLRRDLQSLYARRHGKPDPNQKIGAHQYTKGDSFLALDDISLEINRGERVGIIGANGAGKSTLLKLLSRITSPTSGKIMYRGRIASMLEVGTGFHGELTGRENIYLNGAILGMSRDEVDSKIDRIIEFSECEKFIDTPVKRYSSGMFVKLAFAVASHLDAEIIVMDEVLAVGDMKFQRKCISKMRELAVDGNRTILYVSHNMTTIQELCSRCIVLESGKKTFDGEVDEAIKRYLNGEQDEFFSHEYKGNKYKHNVTHRKLDLMAVKYNGRTDNIFYDNEKILLELSWKNLEDINNLNLRIEVYDYKRYPITAFIVEDFYSGKFCEIHSQKFSIDVSKFATGVYYTRYVFYSRKNSVSAFEDIEIATGLKFHKRSSDSNENRWQKSWGSVKMNNIQLIE